MTHLSDKEKLERYEKMMNTAERARVRRQARITLTLAKAKEKGIVVTEKELDEYLKKSSAK
jgi:hypothetical protein